MPTVLVINSGSSTVKYDAVDPADRRRIAGGVVERIGEPGSRIADHDSAMAVVLERLSDDLSDLAITAVGHRVVHGGERFVEPTLVDDHVIAAIADLAPLAPLHNPGALDGIRALRRRLPDVAHVAVFDTAFHRDLPAHAATYAIPRDLARQHSVRRYGFHGTSFAWVTRRAAELLGRPLTELALVALHLGNGCSAAAVLDGRSVDTSMGLTPLEGLVMGTRVGDLDPGVIFYLHRAVGLSYEEVEQLLTRRSGLAGLAGDNDVRALEQRARSGDDVARAALDVACYRLRKYVGAYAAAMGRLDAVVLTGGIGENSAYVRERALGELELLGIAIDPGRNGSGDRTARIISPDSARTPVLVVPTDEAMEIATQTAQITASR